MSELLSYFQNNTGRSIHKWLHYFPVYERHLSRFRNKPAKVLEIGVKQGGSLQMWKHYFGNEVQVVGLDIDPRTKFEEERIDVVIGDQADAEVLAAVVAKHGPLDVIIDDGSHVMPHVRKSFSFLYPRMAPDGVYLIEDVLTSYMRQYGGGYRREGTIMELAKGLTDDLNAYHSRDPHSFAANQFTRTTNSIHFYDAMIVFERGDHQPSKHTKTGSIMFS